MNEIARVGSSLALGTIVGIGFQGFVEMSSDYAPPREVAEACAAQALGKVAVETRDIPKVCTKFQTALNYDDNTKTYDLPTAARFLKDEQKIRSADSVDKIFVGIVSGGAGAAAIAGAYTLLPNLVIRRKQKPSDTHKPSKEAQATTL